MPLTNEMPAAIKTNTVETRKALCIPVTKARMGADPSETLVPTNNCIITSLGRLLEATARARAKLVTMPAWRKVAKVPEAIPSRFFGEEFMAALVLGG